MQRFFVETYQIEEENHCIHVTGADVNHIKNVLRMKLGEELWISDGGTKEYRCEIEGLGDEEYCFILSTPRSRIMSCPTGSIFFFRIRILNTLGLK